MYWYQRSRSNNLFLGDKNTSYFHTKAIIRKNRNRITKYMNREGFTFDEPNDILYQIANDFHVRFKRENHCHMNITPNLCYSTIHFTLTVCLGLDGK